MGVDFVRVDLMDLTQEREAEEQENRFQCFMDGTGELSLLWALFGERCVHQSLPLSLGQERIRMGD